MGLIIYSSSTFHHEKADAKIIPSKVTWLVFRNNLFLFFSFETPNLFLGTFPLWTYKLST